MFVIRENGKVHVRMLLGPAGSGKTFQCLEEIREELESSPEGPPLVFLTPKPGTYQVERQLLGGSLAGYTRLHILSFERLADLVFKSLHRQPKPILDEQGRVMLIRSLLPRLGSSLKLFHASARQNGFAQQLSSVLSDVQRARLCPADLQDLAAKLESRNPSAGLKLHDVAVLFAAYLEQLQQSGLGDLDSRMDAASLALHEAAGQQLDLQGGRLGGVWVDGFVEFAAQELELLTSLAPFCARATIALCLDHIPIAGQKHSWLSRWVASSGTYLKLLQSFKGAGVEPETRLLGRRQHAGRFNSPALTALETCWGQLSGESYPHGGDIRVLRCSTPEIEVRECAREILSHVQAGGRYRDVMILVRNLESYSDLFAGVLARYQIPFFLDRRKSVAHHPLPEVTRSALRILTQGWKQEDLFAAVKTGFFPAVDEEVDLLENEALARGWEGDVWLNPLPLPSENGRRTDVQTYERLEKVRRSITAPIVALLEALNGNAKGPSGLELAGALQSFWITLNVEKTLDEWARADSADDIPAAAHRTVWEQANRWLANFRLAFSDQRMSLREWLSIVESGLATFTIGVIPPALDQVVIGAVDRSRTPDVKIVLLPGWNEGQFPAPVAQDVLFTDQDREAFAGCGVHLGTTLRAHAGRERYLAYIACTRARQRVVITFAEQNSEGVTLNPSPLINTVRRIFPGLKEEAPPAQRPYSEALHPSEVVVPWLKNRCAGMHHTSTEWDRLAGLDVMHDYTARFARLQVPAPVDRLDPALASMLYGKKLATSVSRLEVFAACPFRFFVSSGLRAEERLKFELDAREQGSFQHEVLRRFHEDLAAERKRWRDLSVTEARTRIQKAADEIEKNYREGLMRSNPQAAFQTASMKAALQEFIEVLVTWMRSQYQFDPLFVEAEFGEAAQHAGLRLALDNGAEMVLRGKIDRVDLCSNPQDPSRPLCVVIDYKSSAKKLDTLLVDNGLQLQLLSYLSVVRHWVEEWQKLGFSSVLPAGVFYVPLRGGHKSFANRGEAMSAAEEARRLAYQHSGRLDSAYLPQFDSRGVPKGDQFPYVLNKSGVPNARSTLTMPSKAFAEMIDSMDRLLKELGNRIYKGEIGIDPYKRSSTTACDHCIFSPVCRIDPWMHQYRKLQRREEAAAVEGRNA